MSKFLKVVVVLLVVLAAGAVAWIAFMRFQFQRMAKKPIVYSVPGMSQVAVRKDIVYKKSDGEDLLADLYLPAGKSAAPYSVVIFIHGALPMQLSAKDWAVYTSWGRLIAASGMAAVTFNHRLRWRTGYEAATVPLGASDLDDLIGYLRDHSAQLGVDPDRICLAAFSAGGVMLATPIRQSPSYIRCYVGFYPYLADPLAKDAPYAARYSPRDALKSSAGKLPPTFIAKAGLDRKELNDSIASFVDTARAGGAEITIVEHPAGHHAFDILDDDDISRAIIKQSVAFMKSHLEPH